MRLKVQNYQNARDIDLVIEGLTVLTGNSNSGKSSTLKALYSATHNRFRGGCVTWGEDACTVTLKYDDDPRVLRVQRSAMGSSPQVRLGNKKDGYLTFSKLNRDVPAEIATFNRFGYINLSSNEKLNLNFCTQFSEPFMVKFSNKRIVDILSFSKASSDAEKARVKITDRNLELKGAMKSMEAVLIDTKEELGKLQMKRNKYQDIELLEKALKEYDELSPMVESLDSLLNELSSSLILTKKIEQAKKIIDAAQKAEALSFEVELISEYQTKSGVASKLAERTEFARGILSKSQTLPELDLRYTELLALLSVSDSKLNTARSILKKAKEVPDCTKLQELSSLLAFDKRRGEEAVRLRKVALQSRDCDNDIKSLSVLVRELESLVEAKESYSKAVEANENRVCPICGNKIE